MQGDVHLVLRERAAISKVPTVSMLAAMIGALSLLRPGGGICRAR